MSAEPNIRLERDQTVSELREALLREVAVNIIEHDAMDRRDGNRRRVRAYAEGLLDAFNLLDAACGGSGELTLQDAFRIATTDSDDMTLQGPATA